MASIVRWMPTSTTFTSAAPQQHRPQAQRHERLDERHRQVARAGVDEEQRRTGVPHCPSAKASPGPTGDAPRGPAGGRGSVAQRGVEVLAVDEQVGPRRLRLETLVTFAHASPPRRRPAAYAGRGGRPGRPARQVGAGSARGAGDEPRRQGDVSRAAQCPWHAGITPRRRGSEGRPPGARRGRRAAGAGGARRDRGRPGRPRHVGAAGAGVVTVVLGLGLLGREFPWAARMNAGVRARLATAAARAIRH